MKTTKFDGNDRHGLAAESATDAPAFDAGIDTDQSGAHTVSIPQLSRVQKQQRQLKEQVFELRLHVRCLTQNLYETEQQLDQERQRREKIASLLVGQADFEGEAHSVNTNWQKASKSHADDHIVPIGSGTDGDADERELKEISNGSNAATVLRAVAERGDPLTSSMIESRVELDQSSVTPACHTLWKRKLIERELTDEGTDQYEYQLTKYGRACLSELEGQK